MDQIIAGLPEWLGTLPAWITAGGMSGILWIVAKVYLGRGELGVKAKQVNLEGDRIEIEGEHRLREHFGAELDRLTAAVASAEERQRACERREEQLRRRVRKLEDDLSGLMRVITLNSATLLLDKETRPSEDVRQAAIAVLEQLAKPPRGGDDGETS